MDFKINNHMVGLDHPTYFIADIAANHDGDLERAKLLIRLAKEAGADFVKTSTGFSKGGATVADIELMRKAVGAELGVKAAGGVKDLAGAKEMIAAGATRIGASAGVKIVQEAKGLKVTHTGAPGNY